MKRIAYMVALCLTLVACSAATGKYTITYQWYVPPDPWVLFTGHHQVAYIHGKHAHDWNAYKDSALQICAEKPVCTIFWFDGEAPATEEQFDEWFDWADSYETYNSYETGLQSESHRFDLVALFFIRNQELESVTINCEQWTFAETQKKDLAPDSAMDCHCMYADVDCESEPVTLDNNKP